MSNQTKEPQAAGTAQGSVAEVSPQQPKCTKCDGTGVMGVRETWQSHWAGYGYAAEPSFEEVPCDACDDAEYAAFVARLGGAA